MVLANVVELFVVVESGVLTLVIIWLVEPVVLGCSVVVIGIGVVAPVEVVCIMLVVGTNPEKKKKKKSKANPGVLNFELGTDVRPEVSITTL